MSFDVLSPSDSLKRSQVLVVSIAFELLLRHYCTRVRTYCPLPLRKSSKESFAVARKRGDDESSPLQEIKFNICTYSRALLGATKISGEREPVDTGRGILEKENSWTISTNLIVAPEFALSINDKDDPRNAFL